MFSAGVLVVSNLRLLKTTLSAAKEYVKKVLYVHLNFPGKDFSPSWSTAINSVYRESLASSLDVRVLISSLKQGGKCTLTRQIDVLLFDKKCANNSDVERRFAIGNPPIILNSGTCENDKFEDYIGDTTMYDNVVLGGTFDRIHVGHKILLTEAVLRAKKRLVVGVTDVNMIKSKTLPELILPVHKRIEHVTEFLQDIDSTIKYEVVAIQDPFGPTRSDPDLDMIIVSAETLKGGQKVNEIRIQGGLRPLNIHCIDMVELDPGNEHKEKKISSSNTRMDLLGLRIRDPEPKPNLPEKPYIIGLTGGIAAGKSKMSERFARFGAKVIDCDKLAHEIYEPGQACYEKILEHFGPAVLAGDGKIDRKSLGAIVFSDPTELEALNNLVWPALIYEVKKRVEALQKESPPPVVFLEAAVLLKAGWQTECHEVWSMIIPPAEAVRRLKERNGLSEEEAQKRIKSQLDNQSVVAQSNVIFSSEWSYEFTEEQARKAWSMLMDELSRK